MDYVDRLFLVLGSLFVTLMGILVLIVLTSLYYEFSGSSCNSKAAVMGLESKYSWATGCMVKVNNQFLLASDVIPIERDGKIVFVTKTPHRLEVNK